MGGSIVPLAKWTSPEKRKDAIRVDSRPLPAPLAEASEVAVAAGPEATWNGRGRDRKLHHDLLAQ